MSSPPTGLLFYDARAKPLSTTGQIQAGCYYQFYTTGTLSLTPVYADGGLTTTLSQTPGTGQTTAASDGRLPPIYLNPATTYRYQLYTAGNILLEDVDPFVPGIPANAALNVTNNAIQGLGPTAGGFIDMTPDTNTFTGTLGGVTSTTVHCSWIRYGRMVILTINDNAANATGTANSTAFNMSGLPASIQSTTIAAQYTILTSFSTQDNGAANSSGGTALVTSGTGTITFFKGTSTSANSWTNASTKGFINQQTLIYVAS